MLKFAQCGLWVNPKYLELTCSTNELVKDVSDNGGNDFSWKEMKCPFMLEKCSVKYFENSISKSQVANFCLERLNDDLIPEFKSMY